jgi:pSer/pThr/pTyr-binding forkhead associated (FHA) protein
VAWLEGPDGQRYLLTGHTMTIGRDRGNDLALANDTKVSRTHARVRSRDGQWMVSDLGSRNGTKVNRRRIEEHLLRDGDQIQVGATTLVYRAADDPNATEADEARAEVPIPELSKRERQVIALIAQGLTDREIGEQLFISASTVRSHLDRISEKTGLRRRAELTRLALELGDLD